MINKIIFLTFFLMGIVNAGVQEVRIGTIDEHYAKTITKSELKQILMDIESKLENQLGFDVFNYSNSGKVIDILYVAPQKLEQQIQKKTKKLQRKKEQIEDLKSEFPEELARIEEYQKSLNKFASYINEMTISLNDYIKNANKQRNFNSAQYKSAQRYVQEKQDRIKREIKNLRKERRTLRRMSDEYNKKIRKLNRLVRSHNMLSNQITRMNRSIKKVKGKTFGSKEISLKTYYKDGKKVRERTETTNMTKIEIYGFENKKQLKAVLAHEIGHLVGIPHINVKNSLMHPILQEKQIENLSLTKEDIRNFRKNF